MSELSNVGIAEVIEETSFADWSGEASPIADGRELHRLLSQ